MGQLRFPRQGQGDDAGVADVSLMIYICIVDDIYKHKNTRIFVYKKTVTIQQTFEKYNTTNTEVFEPGAKVPCMSNSCSNRRGLLLFSLYHRI